MRSFLPLSIFVSLTHAAPISISASSSASSSSLSLDISSTLQNILDNTDGNKAYTYPTDLTRGIIPVPLHSHNDYWRSIPFYSALSVGCISIEADVWLYNSTLYVGHDRSSLTTARTFSSLYINPILDVLKRENTNTPFVASPTRNGVYDTSATTSLLLYVDVKTDGMQTWPFVVEALEPLRSAGYLTTYNSTTNIITPGPVTVIGTGNTPLALISTRDDRDCFFDANLSLLSTSQANLTDTISPTASVSFREVVGEVGMDGLNQTQLEVIRRQVGTARQKGMLARYWDTPAWPISVRDQVWKTLVSEGVGLLNVDDLYAARGVVEYW